RLVAFCKMVGMGKEECRAYMERFYPAAFLLGLDKYQASRAHAFLPLEEYSEAERAGIARTSVDDAWHLVLPRRESDRILARWEDVRPLEESGSAELLVLTNDPLLGGRAPSEEDYAMIFRNATFRAWKRKTTR